MLQYTPPRQVPGVPERHLLYTRLPQVSAPKHLHRCKLATLHPATRQNGHCTALACALLHLLLRTHTCQLQLQLQQMLIQQLP